MILIPTIGLMGGKVVRLEHGRRDEATELSADPLALVKDMQEQGAAFFSITDLDAVFGTGDNRATLEQLREAQVPMQVGGGIRDATAVESLLGLGVDRVVLGTLFFEDPAAAKALVDKFGVRIMAALDVANGEVAVRGWESRSGHALIEALGVLESSGVRHVMYREIDPEVGTTKIQTATVQQLTAHEEVAVYAHVAASDYEALGGSEALEQFGLTGVLLSHAEEPSVFASIAGA